MNVAILHFHLRRGGVTSVMRRQAVCLASKPGIHAILIAGTAPQDAVPVPFYTVPGLDYDSFSHPGPGDTAEDLANAVGSALKQAFPKGCDLLHVHNPLLRKNRRLLDALRILQRRGLRLLVQEHDFAEDFRPAVYDLGDYPEDCVWATVNPRDRRYLIDSGLPPDQVHYLPNPVSFAPFQPPKAGQDGRATALYPVRAIRRKNVGEAVLLSRFLPEGAQLTITLPPTSDADRAVYEAWRDFAREDGRVVFEAGLHTSLDDLYAQAFCAVTTSVKEGFGYSYLEPVVRGVPVVGRAVPAAAELFETENIGLDLYSSILVPRDIVSERRLITAVEDRLKVLAETFSPVLGEVWNDLAGRLRARFAGAHLDFGALDETLQTDALRRFTNRFLLDLVDHNSFLGNLFHRAQPETEARSLRDLVLDHFSEGRYGQRLAAVYHSAASGGTGSIDKARLAAAFLDPAAFFLTAS